MRAKIIQYNPTAGLGVALNEGIQYEFSIKEWRSDSPPNLGQSIEITIENGKIIAIFLVSKSSLIKEFINQNDYSNSLIKSILDLYGKEILILYLIFLLSTTLFNAFSINYLVNIGFSIWNIADGLELFQGDETIKFLLILSYVSIILPLIWKENAAWMVLYLPFITMIYVAYLLISIYLNVSNSFLSAALTNAISYKFGIFTSFISSLALTFYASKKVYRQY